MSAPTATVVMAAYNADVTVASAIRSVLAQTWRDFELLVVDDGSTDDTARIVASFDEDQRVRLIRQENRGLAGARNTAIREARGRFVSLVDSDDFWLPTYLGTMIEALEPLESAAVAYTRAWVLDDETGRIQRAPWGGKAEPPPPPPDSTAFILRLLDRNFVWGSATMRRSALDRVGLFNASLRAAEDYEMWLRMAAHDYHAVRPPGILGVYRQRPASLSNNDLLMARSLREVYRLVADEYDVSNDVRAKARSRMDQMDLKIEIITGTRPALHAAYAVRRRLRMAKDRVLGPVQRFRAPPAALVEAVPDLGLSRSPGQLSARSARTER